MTAANPHLRAILIAGALAATAAALGMYTLSRQRVEPTAAESLPAATTGHLRTAPASTTPSGAAPAAKARPTTAGTATQPRATPAAATSPEAQAAAQPAAAVKPKPAPVVDPYVKAALAFDLPQPVAKEFAAHEVVVVTLYSSKAEVDTLAAKEAEKGAGLVGAGFAAVDVTREGVSGKVTKVFGVLSAPASLVLVRSAPTEPFVTLEGYADSYSVAQAADNADPTPGAPATQTAWARRAEALCTRAAKEPLPPAGAARVAAVQRVGGAFVADLQKLKAPPGGAADVTRFVSLQSQHLTALVAMEKAAANDDLVATATATAQLQTLETQSDALAISLGAPACAS